MKQKLPALVQPSDPYLPVFFQAGRDEAGTRLRVIKENSGAWDNWLRAEEHKQCSSVSFQLQGMKRKGTGGAGRSIPGPQPGGTGRILGF